jgi:diguanylate cyclase (GGDEF)-like protein/PAS domain S-box-containing protein
MTPVSRGLHRTAEWPAALSEGEENVQALLDAIPIPLVLCLASDGRVVYGNERAAALFEMNKEELTANSTIDRWVDDAERLAHLAAVLAEGHVDDVEVRLRSQSGRVFWARLSTQAMRHHGELALLAGIIDITEERQAQEVRRRGEETLRRSESALRSMLEAAPTPLFVTRVQDGLLRYCNEPAAAMFEMSVESCVGRSSPDLYVDAAVRETFMETLRREGHVTGFTAQLRASSGRAFWVLMNAKIFDLEGESVFMVGFAELTAQKELEERLRTLATTDALTGAFNRRHFFEQGESELDRAGRYGRSTSLAMVDVDHFKAFNDELGHAAGDAALRGLVALLRREVRSVDLVARLGGEEFVLLFPETGLRAAAATADRLRRTVAGHSFADHGLPPERRMTVSMGVAEWRSKESLGDFLNRADEALYQAKASGRDRVVAAE